jgi:hypothetical protein
MPGLVRCKSCGYVTEEGKIEDRCPACGVPAKMFEPYVDPVSEPRRKLLGMHIHPILVHFPQAFAFSLFFIAAVSFAVTGPVKDAFLCAIKVVAAFLPAVVLLAFLSGLLDGKTRFRKVTTPFLKRKIGFGISFFIISIAMAVTVFKLDMALPESMIAFTIISFFAVCCSLPLGIIGTWLVEAKFPG